MSVRPQPSGPPSSPGSEIDPDKISEIHSSLVEITEKTQQLEWGGGGAKENYTEMKGPELSPKR